MCDEIGEFVYYYYWCGIVRGTVCDEIGEFVYNYWCMCVALYILITDW